MSTAHVAAENYGIRNRLPQLSKPATFPCIRSRSEIRRPKAELRPELNSCQYMHWKFSGDFSRIHIDAKVQLRCSKIIMGRFFQLFPDWAWQKIYCTRSIEKFFEHQVTCDLSFGHQKDCFAGVAFWQQIHNNYNLILGLSFDKSYLLTPS